MRIHEQLAQWVSTTASNTYQYLSAKLADLANRISQLASRLFNRSEPSIFQRDINAKVLQAPLTLEQLTRELDAWVNANEAEAQDRQVAKDLIIECFKNKTTELSLEDKDDFDTTQTIITELPAVICRLEHLKELDLSRLSLKSLPKEIGSLTNLQDLNLWYNEIEKLPAGINNLKELRVLNLENNQLIEFPDLASCTKLKTILAGMNKISSIPTSIGNLSSLKLLCLPSNALNNIPAEIGNLTSLQELRLSDNQIQTLPPEIGKLMSLTKLDVGNNQLKSLPVEIGRLQRLHTLDIQNNVELTELPLTLASCAKLQILGHGAGVDTDREPIRTPKWIRSDGESPDMIVTPDGTVRYFQFRCDALGNIHYGKWDKFITLLDLWAVVARRDTSFEHIQFFTSDEKEDLEEWLEAEAMDLEPGQQKETAAKVCEMLEGLKDNEAWKKIFFEGLDEELTADYLYTFYVR